MENIEKRKQSLEKKNSNETGVQKNRVLRPWESFDQEPDLLEMIKNKKTMGRITKKTFERGNLPKDPITKNLDIQEKLKEISKKYFGDII